jgi:glycosyltransferase involved in cell wall biosynthesis
MNTKSILITAPSLDTKHNVSGISSVTNFIIGNNAGRHYEHFELGRKDEEKRNLGWWFRMVQTVFKWMFKISSKKIGLVHFNFALSKAAVLRDAPLIIFAKMIRKKMVIHLHGGDYLTNKKAPGWMRFLLKRVFSGKTPVLVLSPLEQEAIVKTYGVQKVQVLPNCVDLNEAKAFNRVYDQQAPLRLLFIGRISTSKGLDHIYNGLSLLHSRQVPFTFSIAGTGPDEKMYREKFVSLLDGVFEFKGVVSGATKTALFKNTDIFLLPSHFEGLPMALLEGMSFGQVPMVTQVGSMKYVVQHNENGVILENDPATEIADAVQKLDGNRRLAQQWSINAAAFIFKHYDPDQYVKELNCIYTIA